MNNITAKLAFQGACFTPLQREQQTWLKMSEIETALGYAAQGKTLARIYARHADEFTKNMTRVVKLSTAGGKQAVRVFSLRGAHLLAMFARTDAAKAFRVWVLDILDRELEKPRAAQVKSYHFPIRSAAPQVTELQFGDAQLSARVLLDPKNRAPEMELIAQLEADGHDVSGAKVRILAMRNAVALCEMARQRAKVWQQSLQQLLCETEAYSQEQGLPLLLSRVPSENDPLDCAVYGAQMVKR
jgi:prophage antirepressor-like protein